MSAQHHSDWCMSLYSRYILVTVFSDIIMVQRCLNDMIMFWEQKGAMLRGIPHTYRHCDSAYYCADLSHQHDVCRLKQTCTSKGAARKHLTIVTDVMISNYAVGLDVAHEPWDPNQYLERVAFKLPIDSLPLQIFAKSPELMSDLSKQPPRNFPSAVAG